jgi:hypothetical protein
VEKEVVELLNGLEIPSNPPSHKATDGQDLSFTKGGTPSFSLIAEQLQRSGLKGGLGWIFIP